MDSSGLMVKKDVARQQIESEKNHVHGQGEPANYTSHAETIFGNDRVSEGSEKNGGLKKKHFYGVVDLKPTNAILQFDQIIREVIQHFSSKVGTDVKIKVEIESSSKQGFDEAVQRIVKENSRTLGFKQAEFEEE